MTNTTLGSDGLAVVAEAIAEAEAAEIAPRFRRLATGDVEEKSPGEVVTAADRACEAVLSRRLAQIADIPIIGEEAVAANPALLDLLGSDTTCWLVDPLDGTANFAAGSPDYAVMVAYVHHGVTTASWIWVPAAREMYIAERGAGAACNGQPVTRPPATLGTGQLTGVIKVRFLPTDVKQRLTQRASEFGPTEPGVNCAGIEYPNIISGATDYILYWRTLPWDHAPGVLLATETGCVGLRPNSTPYEPHSRASGLLVAPAGLAERLVDQLLRPAD